MPHEDLPPDPDSVKTWEALPRNQPSRSALPPIAGGTQWAWWLLGLAALIVIIALVLGR